MGLENSLDTSNQTIFNRNSVTSREQTPVFLRLLPCKVSLVMIQHVGVFCIDGVIFLFSGSFEVGIMDFFISYKFMAADEESERDR